MDKWGYKGGKGIWTEYVNADTKESSIKNLTLREVKKYCKKHYFIPSKEEQRHVVCKKCGIGAYYVLGLQKLHNGKITNITPQG